jgi:hypothetical protein
MLWAITSYFNPCQYRRRLTNYHEFRRRLRIPLITVELSFCGEFELESRDADVMIRLQGRDVMWQKERLLNIALEALPADCDKVAWLDCDVVFEDHDWHQAAAKALDLHPVIQPFERSLELHRDTRGDQIGPDNADSECESLAKALASGRVRPDILQVRDKRPLRVNCGMAWAARRPLLRQHGLYDACIVGCGDGAVIAGIFGNFEDITGYLLMNPQRKRHYLDWAGPFHQAVQGSLGYSAGTIYHLWHGDREDRHYLKRRVEFADFDFDPYSDLALDDSGCWRWNSEKPEMHAFVNEYFGWRMEDGRAPSDAVPQRQA